MFLESASGAPLRQLSRHRWWRDVILGIALFTCGFIVGGILVTKYYISLASSVVRDGVDQQKTIAWLQRLLDLNEDQAQRAQAIIARGLDDLRDIRYAVRPQVEAVLERIYNEVSSLLDHRQKQIWERRFSQIRERWFPPLPENQNRPMAPNGP